MRPTRLAAFVVALGVVRSAGAQQEVWSVEGNVHDESFGAAIALLPDRTGDGISELLVGAPPGISSNDEGMVRVLSGADLSILLEIGGAPFRGAAFKFADTFGAAVAAAGDVDGDAIEDLLVGAPNRDTVYLYAGSDGHELSHWNGTPDTDYGMTVVGLDDVNGDGTRDFAVGSSREPNSNGWNGIVRIVSGLNGRDLFVFENSTPDLQLGARDRLTAIGDLDGDTLEDFALLDTATGPSGTTAVARLFSSGSGSELLAIPFDQGVFLNFKIVSIGRVGDFDGDGTVDVMVGGVRNGFFGSCAGFVMSGATGSELRRIYGPGRASWVVVGGAGDLDGDARPELLLSCDGTSATTPFASVRLYRGSDGLLLKELVAPSALQYGRAFVGGADFDGDGVGDVAFGIPDLPDPNIAPFNAFWSGAIETWSLPAGVAVASRLGRTTNLPINSVSGLIDDVDGDGFNDLVTGNRQMSLPHTVRVRSGRDGHVLADHPIAQGEPIAFAALPDLDGDAIGDYAVSLNDFSGYSKVELRSSVTGVVLRDCVAPSPHWDFGHPLVVGLQPNGAVEIAVGTPQSGLGAEGGVDVFDALTGAPLFQKLGTASDERFGSSLAFVGDQNRDGVGDWAAGAPKNDANGFDAGRVIVFAGQTGNNLKILKGGTTFEWFGTALANVGDQNGDGIDDVAIGAPAAGANIEGEVRIYAGRVWTLLSTFAGASTGDMFGNDLFELGDLNRDGVEEWLTTVWGKGRSEIRSGANGSVLATVNETLVAAAPRWQSGSPSGDRPHDLVITNPYFDPSGRVALFALDDLMLVVEPAIALPGDIVFATVTGGPASQLVMLLLETLNGFPVSVVVDSGALDALGARSISDRVPSGLTGTITELRAYAIGFNGKLMKSALQPLRFD